MLEKGPNSYQSSVFQILHCMVHYIDISSPSSSILNSEFFQVISKHVEVVHSLYLRLLLGLDENFSFLVEGFMKVYKDFIGGYEIQTNCFPWILSLGLSHKGGVKDSEAGCDPLCHTRGCPALCRHHHLTRLQHPCHTHLLCRG